MIELRPRLEWGHKKIVLYNVLYALISIKMFRLNTVAATPHQLHSVLYSADFKFCVS